MYIRIYAVHLTCHNLISSKRLRHTRVVYINDSTGKSYVPAVFLLIIVYVYVCTHNGVSIPETNIQM